MKIRENPRKSMKIHANLWKVMKSVNMYETYLFWKEKTGYILHSKKINASHICPPKRNKLLKQREWKSGSSGKHRLRLVKHKSKCHFSWKADDLAVIPHILPQVISPKPMIKVQFLTKVLTSIFPKVWDSFQGQYSMSWRNSWGKFDANSIRTRLEWSQEPWFLKKSWTYVRFLRFWSSAAEAAACK